MPPILLVMAAWVKATDEACFDDPWHPAQFALYSAQVFTGAGVAVGAGVGAGVAVGRGVGAGVAVGRGVGAGVAVGRGVGAGVAVGLGVGAGVAVGRGVAVGLTLCSLFSFSFFSYSAFFLYSYSYLLSAKPADARPAIRNEDTLHTEISFIDLLNMCFLHCFFVCCECLYR